MDFREFPDSFGSFGVLFFSKTNKAPPPFTLCISDRTTDTDTQIPAQDPGQSGYEASFDPPAAYVGIFGTWPMAVRKCIRRTLPTQLGIARQKTTATVVR